MNSAQIILIALGVLFVATGLWALVKDKATDLSGASALRGFRVEGPAWLVLTLVGAAFIVVALVWFDDPHPDPVPPNGPDNCEVDDPALRPEDCPPIEPEPE